MTGTLTPVTNETFAKWKKERLDKKAAEEQARIAKEATGRAMFEKGGWEDSESEEESEDDDEEEEDDGGWDLERMRRETERERERKDEERIGGRASGERAYMNGVDDGDGVPNGVDGDGSGHD